MRAQIEENKERKMSYWLIVFPMGTKLTNYQFSGNATKIVREGSFVTATYIDSDGSKYRIIGSDSAWRIAVGDGTRSKTETEGRKKKAGRLAAAMLNACDSYGEEDD